MQAKFLKFQKNAVNLIKVGLYCYENNRKE